jgi:hypothetical protein
MTKVDYIKQIQTKVNRRIRTIDKDFGVSKEQVRKIYLTVVKNPAQPTTKEISQATELLTQQFTVTEKAIEQKQVGSTDISAQNQPLTITKITPKDNPEMWETLPPPEQLLEPQSVALTQTESELATQTQTNLPTHQPTVGASINQTEITSAIAMAVKQVGENGNTEAIQLLTSLAEELSSDISDTQEMVAALVSAYLDKRQFVLSSAIGTLNNLRLAQTSSFQSGLNDDFFAQKSRSKRQFLTQIEAMFN